MNKARVLVCLLLVSTLLVACSGGGGDPAGPARQFISIGTAPIGGVFYTVGGAVADVLTQVTSDLNWRFSAESTGGSMENIRRLDSGEIQFGISNSSITYFAVRGQEGWEKAFPIKSVMTLFPNVAMFVTRQDSGINSIPELAGKRISIGPQGAGFEYFVRPLVEGHGLTFDDFDIVFAGQQSSVDYLGDGSIAAAFLGGGVPTASITSAASSMAIRLIPFGETERQQLIDNYPFFHAAVIPAGTYRGQDTEYAGITVGSAHIIVRTDADEELVYEFTKRIYENRAAIAEKHRAARAINPQNVVSETGTEFHPGAIRYYQEAGIWPN